MKYYLKQKIFSFIDEYFVKNEMDENIYKIESNFFQFPFSCKILDSSGNVSAKIVKELLTFLPKYQIFNGDDTVIANINMEFSILSKKYSITSQYGDIKIEGDIFGLNFSIVKDNEAIAIVNKDWIHYTDFYVIDVVDAINPAFIIALVIIIDNSLHNNNN